MVGGDTAAAPAELRGCLWTDKRSVSNFEDGVRLGKAFASPCQPVEGAVRLVICH
jgi:hypothetical protein